MSNCKVIALTNQKGGVGKTTTAVNLGVCLSKQGKKVLLVDADAQANLTMSLGYPRPDDLPISLATIMQDIIDDKPFDVQKGILHHSEGVDLLPSNIELSGLEVRLINAISRERVLTTCINEVKKNYDYVLVDCMPSLGMLTINALAAADSVVIPTQPHYLSAKGLELLLRSVSKVRRQINPHLRIDGILMTMVMPRTNISKEVTALVRRAYGQNIKVFDVQIPHSSSAYTKTIWHCVTATKHGKKNCPHCKGIPEEVIENAFVKSYQLLCSDQHEVVSEFLQKVEDILKDDASLKRLPKIEKEMTDLQRRKEKLLDLRLDNNIDRDIYDKKNQELSEQLKKLQAEQLQLVELSKNQESTKTRIREFRKNLNSGELLESFDRVVFESVVERIIIGGYNDEGVEDPLKITFVYKTGIHSNLNAKDFKPKRKNAAAVHTDAELCSYASVEDDKLCLHSSSDTCGSRVLSTSGEFVEVLNFREDNEESSEETTGCKASVYAEFDECTRSENFIEILRFRHFARYMSFTPTGKQGKKNRKDACFQNFWKMSVLFFYSKAKEKIKNGNEERNVFIRESRAGCRCFVRQIPIWRKQPFQLNL